jgi:hypothetical protein
MAQEMLFLKLITGENLISKIDTVNDEYVNLDKPLQIFIHNNPYGAVVRLAKWLPFINEDLISIKLNHIIISSHPDEDLGNYYLEAVNKLEHEQEELEQMEFMNSTRDMKDEAIEAMYEKHSNNNIVVH